MNAAQAKAISDVTHAMLTTLPQTEELELCSMPISVELGWRDTAIVELGTMRAVSSDDVHVQAKISDAGAIEWWIREYPNESWTLIDGRGWMPDA